MTNILIQHARVIDPSRQLDKHISIALQDGDILAIKDIPSDFKPDVVIDANECIVCPGFIDLSCHLPEPGLEQKGTIVSETRAAVAGGFTQICCTPDVMPAMDSAAVVNFIHDKAKEADLCEVYPIGALTQNLSGDQLTDLYSLKAAGVVAVTQLRHAFKNHQILHSALSYAATHDVLVMLHPNDETLANQGCVHEGKISTLLGLAGIPEVAETVALARDLILVEETGVRAHFSQISTAKSVEMIANAKQKGLPITADVTLAHLLFSEENINQFDTNFHILPPFRTIQDREALLDGVKTGVIDAICSNHRPHEWSAKQMPFAASSVGMSTLETLLPCLLKLVAENIIDLATIIKRLTQGPAHIINKKSQIKIGETANLCIFNPTLSWEYTPITSFSQGKNSPFLHQTLKGRVTHTIVNGKLVYALQ